MKMNYELSGAEPGTRKKLLNGLSEKGFGIDSLTEMQRVIEAEQSDLFDVLAFVAYADEPLTRGKNEQHEPKRSLTRNLIASNTPS